jgi:hypothetical protein
MRLPAELRSAAKAKTLAVFVLFNKTIRQFVWALVMMLRQSNYQKQVTREFNEFISYTFLSQVMRFQANEISSYFELKSLIMAQIERWRQA